MFSFVCLCSDDERLYGFIRIDTGDELSKRAKFVLITWVGTNVSALRRAKMSIDKSLVKTVITVGSCNLYLRVALYQTTNCFVYKSTLIQQCELKW